MAKVKVLPFSGTTGFFSAIAVDFRSFKYEPAISATTVVKIQICLVHAQFRYVSLEIDRKSKTKKRKQVSGDFCQQ